MPDTRTDDDRLMDHQYDGIQEYDNPLPGWWKAIFVISIIWSVGYGIYYHLGGPGVDHFGEYDAEMAAFYDEQAKRGGPLKVTAAMVTGVAKDAAAMGQAKALYMDKCAQCHGKLGEGGIGPNLTDEYWIHGGSALAIYKTVDEGVPEKGMLAWGKELKAKQVVNLAAYVTKLVGTNPPNGKKAEGEKD